jgi:hypothetical protein
MAGIQGSGRAAAARGPIAGFGSIFVNGVEYSTSSANVIIDNLPGSEAQLRAGQIVTVKGTVNDDGVTGTATEVTFDGTVAGPISAVDAARNTFVVLGQTVRVNGSTLYGDGIQPTDLTGLAAGARVEVSGFASSNGEIVASHVGLEPSGNGLRVTGAVRGLDEAAHTFRINGLTVDYTAALLGNPLANGNEVDVQGTALGSASALVATQVNAAPGLGASTGDFVNISGLITGVTSLLELVLDGQVVIINPLSTQLVLHGVPLGLDVEVDVQGTLTTSGALLAKKIEVKPQGGSLIRGLVDSVSGAGTTLSVLGVSVTASASTEVADKSSQRLKGFRLSDLHVGDYVEIHGTPESNGGLRASTVVRDKPETRSYLEGPALVASSLASTFVRVPSLDILGLNVNVPGLTVLGVNLTTNARTHFEGPVKGAVALLKEAPNHTVKVSGSYAGGVLTADRVQVEH